MTPGEVDLRILTKIDKQEGDILQRDTEIVETQDAIIDQSLPRQKLLKSEAKGSLSTGALTRRLIRNKQKGIMHRLPQKVHKAA
jgi:hypothetical protein